MASLPAAREQTWGFPINLSPKVNSDQDACPRTQACSAGNNDPESRQFDGHTAIENTVDGSNHDHLNRSDGVATARPFSDVLVDDSRSYITMSTLSHPRDTFVDIEPSFKSSHYSTCGPSGPQPGDRGKYDVDTVHSRVCKDDLDLSKQFDEDDTSDDECSSSEHQSDSQQRKLRRKPAQDVITIGTTWLDKDDTGDYDPKEEQAYTRRKRRRISKQARSHGTSNAPTTAQDQDVAGGHTGSRLTVLRLRHATTKLTFAKLTKELEIASKFEDRPQRRLRAADAQVSRSHDNNDEHKHTDNPIGNPVQRGCYECAAVAEKCSLLEDERQWPCQSCVAVGNIDCDLITPPVRKLACQLCKRNRITCSFTTSRNQGNSCRTCSLRGFRCVAGPVKEFIRPRIRYDRDWKLDPMPKSRSLNGSEPCPECHEANRCCSLTLKNDGYSPCTQCIDRNLLCTIGQLPAKHTSSPNNTAQLDGEDHAAPISMALNSEVTAPNIPQLPAYTSDSSRATISTSFAHPVRFNVKDTSSNACHFCQASDLAVFGLGRRHVSVIDTPNGNGWIETSGGHRATGNVKSTRMCVPCTTHRVQILTCEKHDMVPLTAVAHSPQDEAEALQALLTEQVQNLGRYCSLCPSLASYECKTKTEAEGDEEASCELKLCERCMLVLMGTHNGRLNEMLTQVTLEPYEGRPFGFRADCEFLREDGALMKYIEWMSISETETNSNKR